MKFVSRIAVIIAITFFIINSAIAQEQALTQKYKEEVIEKLSNLMVDLYVFPDVAEKTAAHLQTQFKEGHFDQFENDESFAAGLTESVQSINKDKHMRIMKNRPYVAPENSPERKIEEQLGARNRSRSANMGFNTVKILEGNVGYLDYRGFAGISRGKSVVDAYMKLLSQADAIIIDLSKNGGGDPAMVQYLCSHFFDEKVHLNSLYFREGDRTIEFWTLDEVEGEKLPDVPLFVITSSRTFSGAEEFSYNMQTQKRATLIGQTSGGGANPGGTRGINANLSVFIPTGKAINPITKTNWEGVGVIPEIKTTVDETFAKAHEMAKEAAEAYRNKEKEKFTKLYMDLNSHFGEYISGKTDGAILQNLTKCIDAGLLTEWDINILGYDHLMANNKPKIAQSILRANTLLFPNSSNVYDSYAESLMATESFELAVDNYKKAVDLAEIHEDDNLELFKKNLENAKSKLKMGK